jgi:hypothetical protein
MNKRKLHSFKLAKELIEHVNKHNFMAKDVLEMRQIQWLNAHFV